MQNYCKITVITVAYNALSALQTTANSVLEQDYDDIEYIIVDGGSTDGTTEFLSSLQAKNLQWTSENDRGIYDAMNKGVAKATGEYCIFMNAGDTFAHKSVVKEVMEACNNSDVMYGDIIKHGSVKRALTPRNCHKMYYCHQSAFVKTTCLKEFPFDIKHRFSADFKQSKQLFLAGKTFQQLSITIACFDTSGISNTQRSRGLWDNITVVWEVDNAFGKLKNMPRLLFTWALCKLRGK